ncbi:MAG: hypothetical protein HQL06_12550 [Nitrospirae bacterium]|nr:hypothetical protein [Nitrospirota bacterium]
MFKFLLGLCICLMMADAVIAAPPENYTANMTLGGMTMTVAYMDNKMRVENSLIKGIVFINLNDQKKTVTLSNDTKSYLEQPFRQENPSPGDKNVKVEKVKVGNETVNEHPCTKYNIVFYLKDKPKTKYEGVSWEADDLGGLIIKYEVKTTGTKRRGNPSSVKMELTNIKIGAADRSMFEVPKNYKRVNSMQDLMSIDIDDIRKPDDGRGTQPDSGTGLPNDQRDDEVYQ